MLIQWHCSMKSVDIMCLMTSRVEKIDILLSRRPLENAFRRCLYSIRRKFHFQFMSSMLTVVNWIDSTLEWLLWLCLLHLSLALILLLASMCGISCIHQNTIDPTKCLMCLSEVKSGGHWLVFIFYIFSCISLYL